MSSKLTPHPASQPESWSSVAAGLVIFLAASLQLITSELPRPISATAGMEAARSLALWVFLLAPVAGLSLGWIKGFPRWSYPYVPLAGLLALYLSNVSTPGLTFLGYPTFGRELWGLRSCLPMLLGIGIALLITRSFQPALRFFTQLRQDWTLATYALSGTLPLVVFIAYDEIDRAYSIRDLILLSLAMLSMALLYLRSQTKRQRSLTLLIGILIIIGYTAISTTVYWYRLGPQNVSIPMMFLWTVILIIFYFAPGIISVWKTSTAIFRPEA